MDEATDAGGDEAEDARRAPPGRRCGGSRDSGLSPVSRGGGACVENILGCSTGGRRASPRDTVLNTRTLAANETTK